MMPPGPSGANLCKVLAEGERRRKKETSSQLTTRRCALSCNSYLLNCKFALCLFSTLGTCFARDLANERAAEINPKTLAEAAVAVGEEFDFKVQVLE